VDVGLGSLDMVVEIITEGLDMRDDILHPLGCKVARE
jgi:hypothetical protein